MWCVRTDDGGAFRSASRHSNDGGQLIVLNVHEWSRHDSEAAMQFAVQTGLRRGEVAYARAEEQYQLQLAFNAATGLSDAQRVQASINDAVNRYGGTYVTATWSTGTRTGPTADRR